MYTGHRQVYLADASWPPFGNSVVDWSSEFAFCPGGRNRLYIGDVDGDDQDDLLCHDIETGIQLVDYADDGEFYQFDAMALQEWCSRDEHVLY